jgi:hypothetical protein
MALLAELLQRTGPLSAALPEYWDVCPAAAFGFIRYELDWGIIRSTSEGCRIPPVVLPRGSSREDVDAAIRRLSPDAVILSHPVTILSVHDSEPSLRLMRDIYRTAPWVLDKHPDIREKVIAFITLDELEEL